MKNKIVMKIKLINKLIIYTGDQYFFINLPMSIIIADLDSLIISFLELPEYVALMNLNHHYYYKIKCMPLIMEWNKCKHLTIDSLITLFGEVCNKGFLNYAKSLICRYEVIKLYQWQISITFFSSCCRDNVEMTMWLFNEIDKSKNSFDYNQAFIASCANGQIETAKWLISITSNKDLNIHSCNEAAFRWSFYNCQPTICKWLIDLGENYGYGKINIHSLNDYICNFHKKKNDNNDLIKWLIDLGENHGYGKLGSELIKRID